jgi:hypothetical protein
MDFLPLVGFLSDKLISDISLFFLGGTFSLCSSAAGSLRRAFDVMWDNQSSPCVGRVCASIYQIPHACAVVGEMCVLTASRLVFFDTFGSRTTRPAASLSWSTAPDPVIGVLMTSLSPRAIAQVHARRYTLAGTR